MIRKSLSFALVCLFFAAPTLAAEDNGRVCALTRAYECTIDGECNAWTIEEMALPRFVRIDLAENSIISLDKTVNRDDTRIAQIKELEGMTVLQGVEQRGWSIALGKESGSLTLSAAGEGNGFIVFGYCMNP